MLMSRPAAATRSSARLAALSSSSSSFSSSSLSRSPVVQGSRSPAAAPTTVIVASPPLSAVPPPLLRLPSNVFVFICQMLTLVEKLTALTYIHRSLPRLTPAAFRHDCLRLGVDKAALPGHLQPLLSAVSSLYYDFECATEVDDDDDEEDPFPRQRSLDVAAFCHLAAPSAPSAWSPLVNLRHLALRIPGDPFIFPRDEETDEDVQVRLMRESAVDQLAAVVSSPSAFPHLTSIQLDAWLNDTTWLRAALPSLSSLRRVIITAHSMSVDLLLALLRLPSLTDLEVNADIEHANSVAECGCHGPLVLSSHCHTLFVAFRETLHQRPFGVGHRELLPSLFEQLATESQRATYAEQPSDEKAERSLPEPSTRLRTLRVDYQWCGDEQQAMAAMLSIASIRCLRTIDLFDMGEPDLLVAFVNAASPSSLPYLQDLRVLFWEASHAQALHRFARRFASQLRSLLMWVDCGLVADQAFAVALQCVQLRRLNLYVDPDKHRGDPYPFHWPGGGPSPLPLHTLIVENIDISNKQLGQLLHCCPALEDARLHTWDLCISVICALSEHRRLRRLSFRSNMCREDEDSKGAKALRKLLAAMDGEKQLRPFTSLRFLRVDWAWYRSIHDRHVQELLPLLPAVFRCAPLVVRKIRNPAVEQTAYADCARGTRKIACGPGRSLDEDFLFGVCGSGMRGS